MLHDKEEGTHALTVFNHLLTLAVCSVLTRAVMLADYKILSSFTSEQEGNDNRADIMYYGCSFMKMYHFSLKF